VVDRHQLEAFARAWKYHDPLRPEQFDFAGRAAIVETVGYYHGGDVLYTLAGVSGVWHEPCVEADGPDRP
jgi:hypothetical protein